MDYTEFRGKSYPHQLIPDGTEHGFYSIGSFWDYSVRSPYKTSHTRHVFYGFMIGKGLPELIDEGSWDEPPLWEPVEYEMIIVRPKLRRF